ncbi:unknown [Coraliomargarita sp. CAG:312]|nr:unknown [Coraliomargarita sp. CAG:312]
MAKIDGPENERAISFTFVDSQGKPLFTTSVKEQELYKFE